MQIKTAIAHAVAVFCVVGMFHRNNQRGDRSPQIPPLHPPMGLGDTPKTPRNGVYLKYTDIKNADVF